MNPILSSIPIFQGLKDQELAFLTTNATQETLAKDEVVFEVGSPPESLYIVLSGQVKLYNIRKGSTKEEIVCLSGPGHYFCLAPVLSREVMHINAKTIKETDLLVIPKSDLEQLIDQSHTFAKNIIRALAGKECDLCEQVCDLSLTSTKERLAKYLLDYSRELNKTHFKLPVRQNELASHLGTVRETLSRDFSSLRKAGLIDMSASRIKILDQKGLSQIAQPQPPALNVLD